VFRPKLRNGRGSPQADDTLTAVAARALLPSSGCARPWLI